MNEFLSTSTEGGLLKDYYPTTTPMSMLAHALKKRRRQKMINNPDFEPQDKDTIDSLNEGYAKGLF